VAAAVVGLGLVTKFSLLVLAPVLVAAVVVVAWRQPAPAADRLRQLGTHLGAAALVLLLVVNVAYRFEHPALRPADRDWIEVQSPAQADGIIRGIDALDAVVPTYFLFGAWNVWQHNEHGHSNAVLGHGNDQGYWWYFPVAFALKTSLPFLLLAVAGVGAACWRAARRRDRVALALLVPLVGYTASAMSGHIDIGVRHVLPAYPFLALLAGAALVALARRRGTVGRVVLGGAVAWTAVVAVAAFPTYQSHLNELACCGPGYEYLSDSNVEWGGEVDDLARYLVAHGETEVTGAVAGAHITLGLYGVAYHDLLSWPEPPAPATYVAIGASYLNGSVTPGGPPGSGRDTDATRRRFLAEWRDAVPERVFGDEIYLFRVDGVIEPPR
jgi:hypothetical protein